VNRHTVGLGVRRTCHPRHPQTDSVDVHHYHHPYPPHHDLGSPLSRSPSSLYGGRQKTKSPLYKPDIGVRRNYTGGSLGHIEGARIRWCRHRTRPVLWARSRQLPHSSCVWPRSSILLSRSQTAFARLRVELRVSMARAQ